MFFSLNKVKNGPKRPYNGPKRAKNALKRAKNRVFGPKKKVFCLSGIGGYPPLPLTENQCEKKKVFFRPYAVPVPSITNWYQFIIHHLVTQS